MYDEVWELLMEMLVTGAIWPSHSSWASQVILVCKKDVKLGFCIYLRKLNVHTIKDSYSLPRIEDTLESLNRAVWFAALDLKSGYWQVEMDEASKPLMAFTVGPLGFYKCDHIPFRLGNAPTTFHILMEKCLGDFQLNWCLIFLDNITVFLKMSKGHLVWLKAVFKKLKEAGLKLKPSKCEVFKKSLTFLGHRISERGIETDDIKISNTQMAYSQQSQ